MTIPINKDANGIKVWRKSGITKDNKNFIKITGK